MSENLRNDVDPIETQDWLASLDSLIREEGLERAQFIIEQVISQARAGGVALPTGVTTDYVNTIPVSEQPAYPGDQKSNVVFVLRYVGMRLRQYFVARRKILT
ncbi:hypothetical protein NJNGDCLN_02107 [Mannheimia haemolytica]